MSDFNSVLELLSVLDKPRNAIASATQAATSEDPNADVLSALESGWNQDQHVSWGDVFGVPETSSDDTWGEYLAKGGLRLGSDFVLDPLNVFAFLKPLKYARSLPSYQKAAEWAYGTGLGKAALGRYPRHLEDTIGADIMAATRSKNEALSPVIERYTANRPLEDDFVKKLMGEGENALPRHAAELELSDAWQRGRDIGMPGELQDFYKYLKSMSEQGAGRVNAEAAILGQEPPINLITETSLYPNWLPRPLNKAGLRSAQTGKMLGPESVEKSRTLRRWVDEEAAARGELVDPGEKLVITDPAHKLSGIEQLGESGGWRYLDPDTGLHHRVQPTEATLKDIKQAGLLDGRDFVRSPADAYMVDILKKENHKAFMASLQKGIVDQAGIQAGEGGWLLPVTTREELKAIPDGWRMVKAKGLDTFAAPPWAANMLEKQAKALWPEDSPFGMLAHLGDMVLGSKFGQLATDATNWWKRNTLAHPGWIIGNTLSDLPLRYAGGTSAMFLPVRAAQAAAIQAGIDSANVFKGISNSEFRKELSLRGMATATKTAEGGAGLLRSIENKGRIREAAEGATSETGRLLLGGLATGAEKYGKMNDAILTHLGGNVELNGRVAVVVDWLKKNMAGATPTAGEIDRAVLHSNRTMIDYSNLGGAQRYASFLIPFYSWQRGILGKTAETVLENPERLARMGRAFDETFTPADQRDKALMDPWMREQAPITGVFGSPFEGGNMVMAGRAIPYADVQRLLARPFDTVTSSINPLFKAPAEMMANYSTFKGRPIDELASTFPGNLINPLIGQPFEMAGEKPFGLDLPSSWNYLMTQAPGGRALRTVSELGRGAGLWEDPLKRETTPGEAATWALTGGRYYPFDAARQQHRRKIQATKMEATIRGKMRWAMSKGDEAGMEHYLKEFQNFQTTKMKMLGFVEGGS